MNRTIDFLKRKMRIRLELLTQAIAADDRINAAECRGYIEGLKAAIDFIERG
jgi:hypothetical protein